MGTGSYITIEKISADDVVRLRKIAIETYTDHFRHLWTDAGKWYLDKVYNAGVLRDELRDANNAFFLVIQGSHAVGYFKLVMDHALEAFPGRSAMELEKIYLRKSLRRKGIGRMCMHQILENAGKMGKDLLWLKAMDCSKEAIAFYRSSGFESCGNLNLDYPLLKPEYRGMVIMKREVSG